MIYADYPAGAADDPRAPYNQEEYDEDFDYYLEEEEELRFEEKRIEDYTY